MCCVRVGVGVDVVSRSARVHWQIRIEVDVDEKAAEAQRSVRHEEAICKRKWRVVWNCNGFAGIGLGLGVALERRGPEYF